MRPLRGVNSTVAPSTRICWGILSKPSQFLGLIFCLCVSHYSWTSFQNLSPLLLQCSAHHSGFQNGGLYHTVYNLKHFFLINAMTGAQTQSYQGSQELLHELIAFPYAWMNYRIALDGCKARGEIERLSYLFQLDQLPCTLHIYSHITPLFHQLCSFSNSQSDLYNQ